MKRLLTATLILFFISSSVNASTNHGSFEGNPIVSIQSSGKELKVDDVPAINYNGRTMVPIYLLKQIGVEAVWNDATYSVNVKVNDKAAGTSTTPTPTKDDTTTKKDDLEILKDTYKWLSDTDMALWMFAVRLQQYADSDLTINQDHLTDSDYEDLNNLYKESLTFATERINDIKINNSIKDILTNQSNALIQLSQTRNLITFWRSKSNDTQITNSLKISLLNSQTITQKNLNFTNKCIHDLIAAKYKSSKNPS